MPEQNALTKEVSPSTLAEDTLSKPQREINGGEFPGEKGKKSDIMTSRLPVAWIDRVLETSSDLRGSPPERYCERDREQRLDWLLRELESTIHSDPLLRVASELEQLPCLTGRIYWNPRLSYLDPKLLELARIMDNLEPQHRRPIESKLLRLIGYPLYSQLVAFYMVDEEVWKTRVLKLSPAREAEAEAGASSRSEVGAPLLRKLNPTLLNITNVQCQPETPNDHPSPTQLCYTPPPPEEDKDLMMASRIG